MKSKDDFLNSLNEVVELNDMAELDEIKSFNNVYNNSTIYKSIILLLVAKMEKYVKDSAADYFDEIIKKNVKAQELPQKFKNELVMRLASQIENNHINNCNKEEYKKNIKNISIAWDDNVTISNIDVDNKLPMSSHGTTEIENIYKKLGFDNILSTIPDIEILSPLGVTKTLVSVKDKINSLIGLRHNIIHSDATPSITKEDVNLFINVITNFVNFIDLKLDESLKNIGAVKK